MTTIESQSTSCIFTLLHCYVFVPSCIATESVRGALLSSLLLVLLLTSTEVLLPCALNLLVVLVNVVDDIKHDMIATEIAVFCE